MNQAIIDASGSKGLTAKLAGAMAQLRAVIFQTLMLCYVPWGAPTKHLPGYNAGSKPQPGFTLSVHLS